MIQRVTVHKLHCVLAQMYEYLNPFEEGTETPAAPPGQERCETQQLAPFYGA